MQNLLEYNSFKYQPDDIVIISYWYNDILTPVKIVEKVGRKYLITHNIEQSKIFNAPDEYIKSSEIIDKYRL